MRAAGFRRFRMKDLTERKGFDGLIKIHGWMDEWHTLHPTPEPEIYTDADPGDEIGLLENADRGDFRSWLDGEGGRWNWDWPFQRPIYHELDKITHGDSRRLMVFMPPRHGKSELVTIRYTAWRLLCEPRLRIVIGSYNQRLANRFSRRIRSIYLDRLAAISRDEETDDAALVLARTDEWETAAGGGVKAVGAGAGITGFGADLIIIDDPIKSRADAESKNNRERVEEWFHDDLMTRLEPNGSVILIQTRWHKDDLAGRLLLRQPQQVQSPESKVQSRQSQIHGPVSEVQSRADHESSTLDIGLKTLDSAPTLDIGLRTLDSPLAWSVIKLPALAVGCSGSPTGTDIIAQGKALGRDPGNVGINRRDPDRVEQTTCDVAPRQGAKIDGHVPGVTLAPLIHPRLLCSSPSATRDPQLVDEIGRRPGEALCEERFSRAELLRKKTEMGSYSFAALYQQDPVPAEGGLFKREWFARIVDRPPERLRWFRGYDLAVSTKTSADYTASFRCALDAKTGDLYIADGFRGRIEFPDQRKYITGRIREERDTEHGIEEALHGQAFVQELWREEKLSAAAFRGIRAKGDKYTRALSWANRAEAGKIVLVRGPWIDAFLDEIAHFPSSAHDDQIDAVSLAVQMIETRKRTMYVF